MSSRAFRGALILSAIVTAGQACMPAVMHGPRIERGLTTGVAASYTAGPRRTRADYGGIPYAYGPVGVDAGYGWVSDNHEGLGIRLGLHVPIPAVVAAQPDLYVQLPKRATLGLDAGVGVLAIPSQESVMLFAMPYTQIGVLRASGSGVYATYGFWMGPDPTVSSSIRGPGAHVPGIAFQNVNGRTTTRIFVNAMIARQQHSDRGDWSVASGMALQFRHRKDSR